MIKSPLKWCAVAVLAACLSTVYAGAPHSGVVLETMNSGGYTYAKIDEGGAPYWIAAPPTVIKKGDKVSFSEQMWMHDFASSTLKRTFDRILFVSAIATGSVPPADHSPRPLVTPHPLVTPQPLPPTAEPIEKAQGGYTVAELFQRKDELNGKTVKVRGRVVKALPNIMGKNWVHIQDGTGGATTHDLIFRATGEVPTVGKVVLAQGKLLTNQDLGYGYVYPVLIDDGQFTP